MISPHRALHGSTIPPRLRWKVEFWLDFRLEEGLGRLNASSKTSKFYLCAVEFEFGDDEDREAEVYGYMLSLRKAWFGFEEVSSKVCDTLVQVTETVTEKSAVKWSLNIRTDSGQHRLCMKLSSSILACPTAIPEIYLPESQLFHLSSHSYILGVFTFLRLHCPTPLSTAS